jgi:peroxiredoxin
MSVKKARKSLAVAETAPGFDLKGADGRSYSLAAALEHGPVLVAFFKVSCPTCQYAFPFLERLYREFAPQGAALWGVSQDSARDSLGFAREFGITFPLLIDEHPYEVSDRYGVQFTPTLFLVGRDGKIEVAGDGFSKADLLEIQKKLSTELSAAPAPLFLPSEQVPEFKPG